MVNADKAAIQQALAILEEEGAHKFDDNNMAIPYSDTNTDKRLKKQINQHKQQHALLSPSRSKAARRASVTLNSKHLHESSRIITESTADIDSYSASHDGSSGSYSTSCSSHKSDNSREMGGKTKRKSHTKRSSRQQERHHNHPHRSKSKKEPKEDNRNNSSSTSSVKVKSSVRFSKYDQINHIPHINDISQQEIDSSWMNEDDYNTIRSRSLRLVEMIEDPKRYPISADTMIVNKNLICVRGLGDMTSQCVHERDVLQLRLQTAIFRMQQQQKEDGFVDPQAIRQVSRKYSKKSIKTARFVGISDRVTISNRHGLRNHVLETI